MITRNDYKYFDKARLAATISDYHKTHIGCVAVYRRHVNKVVQLANDTDKYIKFVSWSSLPPEDKKCFIQRAKDNLLFDINRLKLNEHTMYRVLWNIENEKDSSLKHMLFFILFNYKNDILTDVLKQYDKVDTFLSEDPCGDIVIYNCKFSKKNIQKS